MQPVQRTGLALAAAWPGVGLKPQFMLLPLVLASASAVAWRRPERSVSVLLALAATLLSPLGVALFRPLVSLVTSLLLKSSAKHLSDILVRTTLELVRNEEGMDQLVDSASEAMRKAMTNKQVQGALKETVIDSLQDDHLQQEMIKTLTKAHSDLPSPTVLCPFCPL